MKKTLAAVALLGAFAGSAMADVTVYGRLDTGVVFSDAQVEVLGQKVVDDQSFSMESGNSTTARVGFKGSEKLSDTVTAGFVLESKITGDNGAGMNGFDREAVVYVAGPYGKLYAGRINSMWSDGGSTNFFMGNYSAFGTGSTVGVGSGLMVGHSRADNRLSYVSPNFGGFTFQAEYSFGANGDENESSTDRPMALGVNYKAGAFGAGMVVTYNNEESVTNNMSQDEMTVNVGASYDFGVAKVMGAVQYFKDANKVGQFTAKGTWDLDADLVFDELEGYGVTLGATVPMAGGTWTVGASYTDGEGKGYEEGLEFDGFNVAAQYVYPFSKAVQVYAGIGYTELTAEVVDVEFEHKSTKAMAGMVYRF